jgi:parvulin-like peptidyl-prolyl isomerase
MHKFHYVSWQERPRRSLLIGAIGAAIGLAIAGFGLFTAAGTQRRTLPPEDIALANQRPLLRSDYEAQMLGRFNVTVTAATPQQRRVLLDDMLREELFVQRALELDEPSTDPDARAALVAAVQQQVAVDATARIPTEAQLRQYYQQHSGKYSSMGVMTLDDLVPSAPIGGDAAARMISAANSLREGQALPRVMAEFGLHQSGKADGEQLYFAAQINLGEVLFAAAQNMSDGEVSAPLISSDGWHILVMRKNARPQQRAFDAARSQVYNDYKSDLEAQMQRSEYQYLRDRADIIIAPELR